MAELSPAAQAVLHAFCNINTMMDGPNCAAVLRAAAASPVDVPPKMRDRAYWLYCNGMGRMREHYRSIATELENIND